MTERETGYYWVKFDGQWRPMLWQQHNLEWWMIANNRCLLDSQIEEVGPELIYGQRKVWVLYEKSDNHYKPDSELAFSSQKLAREYLYKIILSRRGKLTDDKEPPVYDNFKFSDSIAYIEERIIHEM